MVCGCRVGLGRVVVIVVIVEVVEGDVWLGFRFDLSEFCWFELNLFI